MSALVLAVSPGPSATEMALFLGAERLRGRAEPHADADLKNRRVDQRGLRTKAVREFLQEAGIVRGGLAAVVGRGGVLRPLEGGTYEICDALLRDAERAGEVSPASLGAALAPAIAAEWGCRAFVVDPAGGDEREAIARLAHPTVAAPARDAALAMRAAARRHARAVERPLDGLRLIVAHLSPAVSLCALRGGRMVDAVELVGEVRDAEDRPKPTPVPGLDLTEALARAERGDSRSILSLQAAAYRIAKAVGELATVLEGEVDAVLVTGSLASAGPIVAEVCRRVEWIAPVFLYREESELRALVEGVMRVLTGEEPLKKYA